MVGLRLYWNLFFAFPDWGPVCRCLFACICQQQITESQRPFCKYLITTNSTNKIGLNYMINTWYTYAENRHDDGPGVVCIEGRHTDSPRQSLHWTFFIMHFSDETFNSNSIDVCSKWTGWQWVNIAPYNGLTPVRPLSEPMWLTNLPDAIWRTSQKVLSYEVMTL